MEFNFESVARISKHIQKELPMKRKENLFVNLLSVSCI